MPELPQAKTPLDSARNALAYFEHTQLPSGQWACEYGGPLFLLPGMVVTWYVTNTPVPEEMQLEISNYLWSQQNEDGGWGLHIEGQSTVFGTAMNYTVLRLLGNNSEDLRLVKARLLLHELGGAIQGPHWAKFWLAVLNVCEWDAVNPVPPELWLIPDWVPIAPWRWWIHMRQVFLPMSYIWSTKYQHPLTPLTRSLRNELYVNAYSAMSFASHRNDISPRDNYHPKSMLLNTVNWALVNIWSRIPKASLTKSAENWAYQLIQWEDENTNFACLGPVNAPMNTLACFIREGPGSYPVQRHLERLHDFMWMTKDGMLCNGTNGVQSWDTAFLIQSVVACGLAEDDRWRPMLTKALGFLEQNQFTKEVRTLKESYRQQRKGAWGFSNFDQGYTVSDCTAEALKAVMMLQALPGYPKMLSDERIRDGIDVLLSMQNTTGGFASYEPTRGSATLLEQLNAAEVFGRIMVEYDYPECTTAVVTALSLFSKLYPKYRPQEVKKTVSGALGYIRDSQRADGSWYGSWGICFTYATMFALESLASVGETYKNSERARRGCEFLLAHQREDGGWGESYKSCEDSEWREHPDGSQVVNTAWAAIGLMEAVYPEAAPLEKALKLIMRRQRDQGDWVQEGIEGVFNKSW